RLSAARPAEACRDFAAAARRSPPLPPADEVSRLVLQHESRYHLKRHRWTGLLVIIPSLFCLGIALGLVGAFAGAASYLLPVVVIAWGLLWPVVRAQLFRAASPSSRAQAASHAVSQQSQPNVS